MSVKEQLYQQLRQLINKRVDTAQNAVQAAEESKSNQTKSSAGDKFETGRAMMQAVEDRSRAQLVKALALQNELAQLPFRVPSDTVDKGSLVYTNQSNYFISIGLGKIVLDGTIFYAISQESPIGQLLQGKKVGESVVFRDKEIKITRLD